MNRRYSGKPKERGIQLLTHSGNRLEKSTTSNLYCLLFSVQPWARASSGIPDSSTRFLFFKTFARLISIRPILLSVLHCWQGRDFLCSSVGCQIKLAESPLCWLGCYWPSLRIGPFMTVCID